MARWWSVVGQRLEKTVAPWERVGRSTGGPRWRVGECVPVWVWSLRAGVLAKGFGWFIRCVGEHYVDPLGCPLWCGDWSRDH